MKNASRVLYTVGKVINIIEIVCAVLMIALGAVAIAMPEKIAAESAAQGISKYDSPAEVKAAGMTILITAIVLLVVSVIIFALAKKATKSLKNGATDTTPHVIMLVIGLFGDIFYFLGGFFGIFGANQEQIQNKQ